MIPRKRIWMHNLCFIVTGASNIRIGRITQSMSRVAKCIDNLPIEGFWGILKRECYYGKRFTDKETLMKMIENYIDSRSFNTHGET